MTEADRTWTFTVEIDGYDHGRQSDQERHAAVIYQKLRHSYGDAIRIVSDDTEYEFATPSGGSGLFVVAGRRERPIILNGATDRGTISASAIDLLVEIGRGRVRNMQRSAAQWCEAHGIVLPARPVGR